MDGAPEADAGPGEADANGQDGGPDDAGEPPCPDADRDGECDDVDPTCNADGTRLACRRVAPECADGTVPEVRDACYTDRCVTWAACADLVGPPECAADADCPTDQVCRLGACVRADCVAQPTVPREDPLYDRFEGTGLDNACVRHEDCFVGGCSGEICAAEIGASTCEGLPYGPTGGCGCVAGQCVWHTDECVPAPDCRVDADCAAGRVCLAGACVEVPCERTPTVSVRDRYYERFEGIGLDNACAADADCVIGGCSGEVCAAEGAFTTCEGLPYGPSGACGCVAGQCVWHRDSCTDPPVTACAPIRDGELGACDRVLGWGVSAATGTCTSISGCGCPGDDTCGGRIFESEAACLTACGSGLCFRDDVPLSCRAPSPVCEAGTVPEVRGGCYTGACVRPEGCLPPPVACAADGDCLRGEVCRDGRCVAPPPSCRGDGDCAPGEACRDGFCVAVAPACRLDADCPAGQVCRAGLCELAECRAVPSVPPDDRYYARFEGTSADNRCRTGADCLRSGCSGEVCAAERVATTCEGLPYGPSGDCGCVDGQCLWHTLDCGGGGPAACDPIRPGEFGLCRMIMGWGVGALSGRCETISGCGCGDGSACTGRIFATEAECQRACASSACTADADRDGVCDGEDSTCESDGSTLTCRRLAPPCPRGTVPEVRDSCYTDRCVSWVECARLRG